MEYDKIKQLMDDMGNSKLTSVDIEFPDGTKVKMEKNNEKQTIVETQIAEKTTNTVREEEEKKPEKEEGNIITSPMIGTFYSKSSPTSEPYVEVGTTVKKGDVLCIIEAMKLMNEIESEYNGTVVEIFAKDGDAIEYGKPLFRIK